MTDTNSPTETVDTENYLPNKAKNIKLLLLSLLLSVVSIFFALEISYDADPVEYFPSSEPDVKFWLDMTQNFGGFNLLMVGLEEQTEALSFDGLVSLAKISDKLNEYKASGILSARSITNVASIKEGEDETINANLLIPSIPRTKPEQEKLRKLLLDDTQILGALISHNLMGYVILIQTDPKKDLRNIATIVQDTVENNRGELKTAYFGAPFVAKQVTKGVYKQLPWLVPLFILFVVAVMFSSLKKQMLAVLIVLFSSVMSLLWWLGLIYIFRVNLTTTGASASLILIALAAVVFGRGAEVWLKWSHSPFTFRTFLLLLSVMFALGMLCMSPLPYLANLGNAASLGVLAIALFGISAFTPLMTMLKGGSKEITISKESQTYKNPGKLVIASLAAVLIICLLAAFNMKFLVNLPDQFSDDGEIGQSLAFFNNNFGGSEFLQISVKGDLTEPANLARLMALTDLLEGNAAFADVRSISQVVAFISSQFSGIHRISDTRAELASLMFFLEGQSDIKPLVSSQWDEAMIPLRIPVDSKYSFKELVEITNREIEKSKTKGIHLAKLRIEALARRFKIEIGHENLAKLDEYLKNKSSYDNPAVMNKLKAFLLSADSPFEPSQIEWETLKRILAKDSSDLEGELIVVISALESYQKEDYPAEVAKMLSQTLIVQRNHVLLDLNSKRVVWQLLDGVNTNKLPKALLTRLTGVVADLLKNRTYSNDKPAFVISGLPAILGTVEGQLLDGSFKAVFVLWLTMGLAVLLVIRKKSIVLRAILESAFAVLLTFALGSLFGVNIDSASAIIYLLPVILTYFLSPWLTVISDSERPEFKSLPTRFAIAIAIGCLTLCMTGIMPVVRIGAVMGISLLAATLVCEVSWKFPIKQEG